MLNKSRGVTTNIFGTKKTNLMPATLKKVFAASNGAKFCNSFCGSLMEDTLCSITFKINENPSLDVKDLKKK